MTENIPEVRHLKSSSGISFSLNYIASQTHLEWYNKSEFPKKDCDFCQLVTPEKESIHSLLRTTMSLFPGHELLISPSHGDDYIGLYLRHMLDITDENAAAAIAFDGSKNVKLKNYHFNCHLLSDKNILPIIQDAGGSLYKEIIKQDNFSIGMLDVYGRNPIIVRSSSRDKVEDAFHEIEKLIGVSFSTSSHPYINLIIWKDGEDYVLAVIPRVVYKPTEYYAEDNSWDIAPGALEMGGFYLTSNHAEFVNLKVEQLMRINDEVSYSNTHIQELLQDFDLSKIS